MLRSISFRLLFVIIMAVLLQSGAFAFKSEHPRYAGIALDPYGKKVLWVTFDESWGTGTGYNMLYADTNFDGMYQKSEATKAKHSTRGLVRTVKFKSMKLPVDLVGGPNSFDITLKSQRVFASDGSVEKDEFYASGVLHVNYNSSSWEYIMSSKLSTSASAERVPVLGLMGNNALKIEVKKEEKKPGYVGINAEFTTGDWKGTALSNVPITITVTDMNGSIIIGVSKNLRDLATYT